MACLGSKPLQPSWRVRARYHRGMEREDHKDRLEVAVRLYNELCAQYPKRFITLFDENGVRISAFNQPDAPAEQA